MNWLNDLPSCEKLHDHNIKQVLGELNKKLQSDSNKTTVAEPQNP